MRALLPARPFPAAPLLAAAFLAAAPPARADDIPGTEFYSGNWYGAADGGSDGAFVYCYASVGYVDGEQIWVSLYPDDSLTVYLTAPGVTFENGGSYAASLMTEVGWPITGEAFGASEAYIGFTILDLDAAIDFLTQGAYLRLLGVGIDQSLDVRGLGGAIAMARGCLDGHTGGMTASAPEPAPAKPVLGSGAGGAKPAQLSGRAKPASPPQRAAAP